MDAIYTTVAFCVVIMTAILFWEASASTIGRECQKMGMFYVGDTVYECKVKK